jgi:apolipoprotein N-acyltransferase
VVAALWTALDHLRSFALSGFPWATLGYAQHGNPALLALAPFTGVYGLSFVTVLGGAALARLALARRSPRSSSLAAGVALATVLAAHAAGLLLRAAEPPEPTETVRVAVLQGNIPQGVKWSREWYERTLGVYEGLSRRALAQGAELIVWPETAVPGVIDTDARHTERLAAFVRETGAVFVLGAVGLEMRAGGEPPRVYDSAFLVDAQGGFTDRYDKSHLVPFGEYIPFQDLLGRFFKAIARGVAETRVTAGAGPRPVELDPPRTGRLTVGVPICYELIFPDVVRRFVRDGAEMLLAITNDAWYGRTGAPYQFLAITALRSAETRVWTARAANTGVSAIIDAQGRVREQTRIFERDLLVADVPRRPAPVGGSFYTRHGDLFAAACWFVVAGIWLAARMRKGKA